MSINLPAPSRPRFARAGMIAVIAVIAISIALVVPRAAFAAPAPALTLSSSTVTSSASVSVKGTGFVPAESLTISFDSVVLPDAAGIVADSSGGIQTANGGFFMRVPANASVGTHSVTVVGATSQAPVSANLTVVAGPTLSLNVTTLTVSAAEYTGVTMTARGFAPGTNVSFGLGNGFRGDPIGSVAANARGVATLTYVFNARGPFPTANPGTYDITAVNDDLTVAANPALFTVVPGSAGGPVTNPGAPAVIDPAVPATPVKSSADFTG